MKSNTMLHDVALINSVIENGKKFRLVFGKSPKFLAGDIVYYNMSELFKKKEFSDYTESIIETISDLESQGCIMYPKLEEVRFWENKEWMHLEFERLNINHPRSIIVQKYDTTNNFKFPFLIKEVHSCGSKGVHKIDNEFDLQEFWNNKNDSFPIIYQKLLNMRKDIRVILVDGKIVLHYWRLNKSKEWKPTSTAGGSHVDFVSFPEKWRDLIIGEFNKLNMSTGAFDIAWQNDDLDTEPYFLEVSPFYMPNPEATGKYKNLPYKEFKLNFWGKDAYFKRYVQIIHKLKKKTIKFYLNH
jgi:glutathione synthase/RimK-type ligase-like ATP-grasp enzyme